MRVFVFSGNDVITLPRPVFACGAKNQWARARRWAKTHSMTRAHVQGQIGNAPARWRAKTDKTTMNALRWLRWLRCDDFDDFDDCDDCDDFNVCDECDDCDDCDTMTVVTATAACTNATTTTLYTRQRLRCTRVNLYVVKKIDVVRSSVYF